MNNKLLVAIDTSDVSKRVVAAAKELGTQLGSEVIVLHLRERELLGRSGVVATEENKEAQATVDTAVAELKDAGLSARGLVLNTIYGHAAREIVEQAKENDVGTIVMGNRGHSELESLIVGSTAHKVLHLADRPVLVIR
ncbi:MAG TPA: universal stress protein [Acidimicrobiales bacterium]|nr:universal stress protein [Acidimicrobiales bacterium]